MDSAESSSPAVYQADTASMIDSIIATPQLKEPIEEEIEVIDSYIDRSVNFQRFWQKRLQKVLFGNNWERALAKLM